MRQPLISIVIPSYNKGSYINKTLESLVNQRYPHFEVIIQDGGSTDQSIRIIKRYAKRHPKIIQWVSKKDKGQLDAITSGFKKAKGSILTFLNADDLLANGALTKVGSIFSKNGDTLWVAGKGKMVNEKGSEIFRFFTLCKNILLGLNKYSLLLVGNYLFQPAVFVSRQAYEKFGPFTGSNKFVMEYDMWLKLGKVQMPKVIPSDLASFRLVKEGMSSSIHNEILPKDFQTVTDYTDNKLILLLHKMINFLRVLVTKFS